MKTVWIVPSLLISSTLLSASDETGPKDGARIVGRMNAPGQVLINGAPSNSRGITWSPVVAGDEVEAKEASTMFRLTDKNRVTLGRDAVVKLSQVSDKHSYVYLRLGEVRFEPVVGRLFICALGHLYLPSAGSKGFVLVNPDRSIRAEDSLKSLATGGNRSCGETGAGLLLSGAGPGSGPVVGTASGIGLATKGAIAAGSTAGSVYAIQKARNEKGIGEEATPILNGAPPVSASSR